MGMAKGSPKRIKIAKIVDAYVRALEANDPTRYKGQGSKKAAMK